MFIIVSYLTPNAYAVGLLFRNYYGTAVADPRLSAAVLGLLSLAWMALATLLYHRRVRGQE